MKFVQEKSFTHRNLSSLELEGRIFLDKFFTNIFIVRFYIKFVKYEIAIFKEKMNSD